MREHFARLFAHAAWADRRAAAALHDAVPEATRRMAHVLAAERIWLLRLRGEDASAEAIWPERAPADLAAEAARTAADYAAFLASLEEEDLAREVAYRNSSGVAFRTSVADILTHVALHGAHHRGQVALLLREGGAAPAGTDFIAFVREGGAAG